MLVIVNCRAVIGHSRVWRAAVATLICLAMGAISISNVSAMPTGRRLAATASSASVWGASRIDGHNALDGVSCRSRKLCVAVDESGRVLSSTNPTGGAMAWHRVRVDTSGYLLAGVSCPATTLCVVVGAAGDVVSSVDPAGGASAWHRVMIDSDPLTGVSCPTASLCVAVDGSGRVAASSDPTGGRRAWHFVDVDPGNDFTAVACPSTSLCVATDDEGDVVTSRDPTGGKRAWHLAGVDGNPLSDVACPAVSLCVAVDENADYADNAESSNVLTSTDARRGRSWRVTFDDRAGFTQAESGGLDAVSCSSKEFCLAADTAGRVLTSIHPTRRTSWTIAHIGDTLDAVTCLSKSLCVGVDGYGRVLTSTRPASATG